MEFKVQLFFPPRKNKNQIYRQTKSENKQPWMERRSWIINLSWIIEPEHERKILLPRVRPRFERPRFFDLPGSRLAYRSLLWRKSADHKISKRIECVHAWAACWLGHGHRETFIAGRSLFLRRMITRFLTKKTLHFSRQDFKPKLKQNI